MALKMTIHRRIGQGERTTRQVGNREQGGAYQGGAPDSSSAAGFSKICIFRPVDFGLLPKLKKSRGDFNSLKDYARWMSIASYHLKGKLKIKEHPLTSSMVVYAIA